MDAFSFGGAEAAGFEVRGRGEGAGDGSRGWGGEGLFEGVGEIGTEEGEVVGENFLAVVPSAYAFGFFHVVFFGVGVVDGVVVWVGDGGGSDAFFDVEGVGGFVLRVGALGHVVLFHGVTGYAKASDVLIAFGAVVAVEGGAALALGAAFGGFFSFGVVFGVLDVVAGGVIGRLGWSFDAEAVGDRFTYVDVHLRHPEREEVDSRRE